MWNGSCCAMVLLKIKFIMCWLSNKVKYRFLLNWILLKIMLFGGLSALIFCNCWWMVKLLLVLFIMVGYLF